MYASSDPGSLGKRAAAALLTLIPLALAGCGGGSSDNPALPPPSTPPASVATGPTGPIVTIVNGVPQLAGRPAVNAILRRDGASLGSGCNPTTERDDPHVASFLWRCSSGRVSAATVSLTGKRQLALSDVLSGQYQSYLSSVAAAQFQADGVSHPQTGDLTAWYLTPATLVVVYPSGTVAFPLSSLTAYLRDPSLAS